MKLSWNHLSRSRCNDTRVVVVLVLLSFLLSSNKYSALAQVVQSVRQIDQESCQPETACQNNNVADISIDFGSCNEEESCSSNSGDRMSIGQGACNSLKAISTSEWVGPQGGAGTCSFNSGDLIIGNLGCVGPSSCSYNTQQITTVGQRTCRGEFSCSYNNAKLDLYDDSCQGDGSCSENAGPSGGNSTEPMVVWIRTGACGGAGSCRGGQGNAEIYGCSGANSCLDWTVDFTTGANAFQLGGVTFEVGANSCTGEDSCLTLSATGSTGFKIGENSCTGAGSCQDITVTGRSFSIGNNSCTAANSCQNCENDVPNDTVECDGKTPGSSGTDSASSGGGDSGSGGGSDAFSISRLGVGGLLGALFVVMISSVCL